MNKAMMLARFQRLDQLVEKLRVDQRYSEEEYLSDLTIQLSVERALEICINICIDISANILTDMGNNRSNSYREIFENLGKEQILETDFAKNLAEMAGFRNVLGHFYMDLDLSRVYRLLQTRLDDFVIFKTQILRYISELGKKEDNKA